MKSCNLCDPEGMCSSCVREQGEKIERLVRELAEKLLMIASLNRELAEKEIQRYNLVTKNMKLSHDLSDKEICRQYSANLLCEAKEDLKRLRGLIAEVGAVFQTYADEHKEKGKMGHACRNQTLANRCEEAAKGER